MSIRFAARVSRRSPRMSPMAVRGRDLQGDNDNGAGTPGEAANDTLRLSIVLRSALRHFAQHGLDAAPQAGRLALAAAEAGRREEYRHWLAVCETLDRRLARAIRQSRRASA